ncbi:hypothetical protein N5J43_08550 [Pseudomonas nicosulfuronedens]|uniref:Uncharacterized protein n=1 Tax=Pseudomonas nicosulfuronedens TaxID=2571105 RepID=A0A5R9R6V1_9PSED|nr:hypothetical protein [Pseudomonas nicosulfuronedens]MDH1010699.1 hypothetical protein [Pseudomonas nicosulfuronedens]MDH1978997.1 hypothetical protein [Pseudomonas nicosulfuronedens]MDH2025898.1 hypothetical protein [Pseudomonas nicosulfuronedens]TLX77355.1 hypothetical protein FAS41_13670 [Pseudomonas nicosulfuronedens]
MNDEVENLQAVRQSPWFRRARWMQGFGLVMFIVAVSLALFTDFTEHPRGITAIAILGALGLLSLVPARFILTVYLMSPADKKRAGDQANRRPFS